MFDHIGIFVSDIWKGYSDLMALVPIKTRSYPVEDKELKVRTLFALDAYGVKYELIEPLGEDSPVHEIIKSANNVLNHVGYVVSNLDVSIQMALDNGGIMVGPPREAKAFGVRTAFILTKLGFVVEFIQDKLVQPRFAKVG